MQLRVSVARAKNTRTRPIASNGYPALRSSVRRMRGAKGFKGTVRRISLDLSSTGSSSPVASESAIGCDRNRRSSPSGIRSVGGAKASRLARSEHSS